MSPKKIKELLPVLQAFAEGKTIQFRGTKYLSPEWHDVNPEHNVNFDISDVEWRVKPMPVDIVADW